MKKKSFLLYSALFVFCISCSNSHLNIRSAVPPGLAINEKKTPQELFTVLFTGDVMLVNEAERKIRANGIDYPFFRVREEMKKYNFVVLNLESPVTGRGEPFIGKPFVFRIDESIAESITALNPACVVVGNNHIMDYGSTGMNDTLAWIKSKDWLYCGAGKNIRDARAPAVLTNGETKIVLLSYNERPPVEFYASESGPGTAPLDVKMIIEDIARFKKKNTLVIVNLHWGLEMTTFPQQYQQNLAHKIIDAGADAIIGNHPHCPQGIEVYKNKLIFYSLGNFISGYATYGQTDNIAVSLNINESSKIVSAEIIPVAGKNKEIKQSVFFLSGKNAQELLFDVISISRRFKTRIRVVKDRGIILLK